MRSISIKNGEFPISGRLQGDGETLLIMAHGFKGFCDWGFFPWFSEKLALKGVSVLRFNFTHNGVSEVNPLEFTRLDLFAKNTYGREVSEIKKVVEWSRNNLNVTKIFLLGHSRGGGMVLLAASECEVDGVITLASVDSVHRFTQETLKELRDTGRTTVYNGRTQQDMPIDRTLIDEIDASPNDFDILAKARNLNCPCLHIHCEGDLSVDCQASQYLAEATKGKLKIIPNSDHVFGVKHPFVGETAELNIVLSDIQKFIGNINN